MSWDSLIEQDRVKEVLRRGIEQDRVPHAYLFFGPYGVGKRKAAIELAKALHCSEGTIGDACDRCSSCSRIDRMIHPDVRFFLPASSSTSELAVAERVALLADDPYATIDFVRRPESGRGAKQVNYPIGFIQEQIRPIISHTSFEGGYKFMVIVSAEAMSEVTSNALLKMLEEPTDKTIFVLTTERPDRLLPTILSRCQPVRFDPLSNEAVEKAVRSLPDLGELNPATIARMAEGSLSAAADLVLDREAQSFRAALLPFLRSVYRNDTIDVMSHLDRISGLSHDQIKLFLDMLLGLVRDLILVRELGKGAPLVNVDLEDHLVRFCGALTDARLEQMASLTEEAVGLLQRNVRAQLVLTSLASGLRRSMLGQTALPLVMPLADRLALDAG